MWNKMLVSFKTVLWDNKKLQEEHLQKAKQEKGW